MAATTTQGTGPGSATLSKPLIVNGEVKNTNLAPKCIENSNIDNKPVLVTSSTVTVTPAIHAGKTVVLSRAAGITVTLPAAHGTGYKYSFILGATVSSNTTVIKVANGLDAMVGRAIACADGGNTVNGWEVASGNDTITLNGTTTGGYAGDTVEIVDIAENLYAVNAYLNQTSTEATPFSSTVS